MPELPEVERGRLIADSVARGRVITRVWCDDDPIVYDGVTPAHVARALKGATVEEVRRRGKQLWFRLDRTPHPLFHFGMTGAFRVPDAEPLVLASSAKKKDTSWPPRFSKIHLTFDDGGELVMTNARRLGRIRLRERPEEEPPISDLGFDPLLDLPGPVVFRALLQRRSVTIKGLLLNQAFAAGVGNWIADEVLFQAGIDPRRSANELTAAEARKLRTKLASVIKKAVDVNAEKTKFPRGWLFHRRWGKNTDARTLKGDRIEFLDVAGRTTAWVPSVQK